MQSSRTDALVGVTRRYEEALEALLVEDLGRLATSLDAIDTLLLAAGNPVEDDDTERELRDAAWDSYRTLLSAIHAAQDRTRSALGELRTTRKAVAGYGGRGSAAGVRLDRDV